MILLFPICLKWLSFQNYSNSDFTAITQSYVQGKQITP